jgi:hypothetical protein
MGSSFQVKKLLKSMLKTFLKLGVPLKLHQGHQALGATTKFKDRWTQNETGQRP